MPNSLHVARGQNQGRKYLLTESDIMIGRDASNFVCVPEIKVSRQHCRILYADGKYSIEDLNSSNGTFVNGTRIERCQLRLGDRIQVGSTEIVFESLTIQTPSSGTPSTNGVGSAMDSALASNTKSATVQKLKHSGDSIKFNRSAKRVDGLSTARPSSSKRLSSEQLLDPLSGTPASKLDEESAYYKSADDKRETSRRFIQVGNDLRFLYHASLATGRNTNSQRMLHEILQLIFDWIAADRGCVFLKNETDNSFEMKFFKCRVELENFEFKVSKSIVSYVRQNKVGVLSSRAAKDKRWGAQPSILRMKTGEVLCVPIQGRDELLGLIYLDTLVGAGGDEYQRFNEDNLKLLIAMAHQAAVAIENEAYYSALLEKERLAAIGETTGVIAHHVKNMLQGVNGGAHLVDSGLKTGNISLIGKGWQIVSRNQDQISRLVIDMLMLARPYESNRSISDINLVVQSAIEQLQIQFESQPTECNYFPNSDIKPFLFDGAAVSSAIVHILNLCLLSCRARESSSITIHVGRRENRVVVNITSDGEQIEVSETNDVLDPFGFGDDQKIYGIGLAVSRKIIAGHDGRILLSHPNGTGNRFVIEIPVV